MYVVNVVSRYIRKRGYGKYINIYIIQVDKLLLNVYCELRIYETEMDVEGPYSCKKDV